MLLKKLSQAITNDIIEGLKGDSAPTQYTEVKNTDSNHGTGH